MADILLGGSVGTTGTTILGWKSIALPDSNYTLSISEYTNQYLEFTGSLTADRDVILPNQKGINYIVKNSTTGNFKINIKGNTGNGVKINNGKLNQVVFDGTNYVLISGGLSGNTINWDGYKSWDDIIDEASSLSNIADIFINNDSVDLTTSINDNFDCNKKFNFYGNRQALLYKPLIYIMSNLKNIRSLNEVYVYQSGGTITFDESGTDGYTLLLETRESILEGASSSIPLLEIISNGILKFKSGIIRKYTPSIAPPFPFVPPIFVGSDGYSIVNMYFSENAVLETNAIRLIDGTLNIYFTDGCQISPVQEVFSGTINFYNLDNFYKTIVAPPIPI